MEKVRKEIAEIIKIDVPIVEEKVDYKVLETVKEDGYTRQLVEYVSGEDKVSAYLLLPEKLENNPAILINHQHNREHHLGKSEVCGLAGNPLQAFGLELARKGFVVHTSVLLHKEGFRTACIHTAHTAKQSFYTHTVTASFSSSLSRIFTAWSASKCAALLRQFFFISLSLCG